MSVDSDLKDLLGLCLWDLGDGTRLMCERLPEVIEGVEAAQLKDALHRTTEAVRKRSASYFTLTDQQHGPPNLWITGILADAQRDSHTIERGVLFDIALIGAVRKMLQAENASIETALVLAGGAYDARENDVAQLKEQCGQNDRMLKDFLERLAGPKNGRSFAGSRQVVEGRDNAR